MPEKVNTAPATAKKTWRRPGAGEWKPQEWSHQGWLHIIPATHAVSPSVLTPVSMADLIPLFLPHLDALPAVISTLISVTC